MTSTSEPLISQLSTSSQYSSASASATVTTPSTTLVNNGSIPVGIAFARQRFISNSNARTPIQDVNKATIDVLSNSSVVVSASSASCSYVSSSSSSSKNASSFSPVLPYHHMVVEPAGLTSSISNIGNLPPSIITWSTHTSNLPAQQQPLTQQWHPYNGSVETQIQNMSSACTNYQLIREPVSSHIMLIPTNGIGVMMPYDFTRTPSITAAANVTVPVTPQLISNNSGFSLVQQFNSSNVHNASVNVPPHFSNLSTSGSFLIQQICAADSRPSTAPLNHVNVVAESVATTAATQPIPAVGNTQSSYARGNASFVYNAEPVPTDSTTLMQQVPSTGLLPHGSYQSNFRHFPPAADANAHPIMPPVAMQICNTTTTSATKHSETKAKNATSFSAVEICHVSEGNREISKNSEYIAAAPVKPESTNSVQDASNQTDSIGSEATAAILADDDDATINESGLNVLAAATEAAPSVLCDTSRGEDAVADKTCATDVGSPDFSGLQLLLNGIERTEHNWKITDGGQDAVSVHGTPKPEMAVDAAAPVPESDDVDADKPNGLQILCALADQRFLEEEKGVDSEATASSCSSRSSFSSSCSSSCAGERKKRKWSKHNGSPPHPHKSGLVLAHRCKNIRSEQRTRHHRHYSRQRSRLHSPDEGPIQMRIELAKLQKKYRETRHKLSQLARLKYAKSTADRLVSPSSPTPPPQSPSPILAAESTPSTKRRPGRPRKSSEVAKEEVHHGRCTPASRTKFIGAAEPTKPQPWSPAVTPDDEAKVPKFNNGDLSPPVLEPMYTSPNIKPLKNDTLGPPPLIVVADAANKKSVSGRKRLLDEERGRSAKRKTKPSIRRHTNPDYSTDEETAAIGVNDIPKLESGILPASNLSTITDETTPPPPVITIQKRKVGRPRKSTKDSVASAVDDSVRKRKPMVPVPPVTASIVSAACSVDGVSILAASKRRSKEENVANAFGKRIEKLVSVASSNAGTMSAKSPRKISSDDARATSADCKPKIIPKLKAEAKLKTWRQKSQDAFEDALQLPCPLHQKQNGYCGCASSTVEDGSLPPPPVASFERWHSKYEDNEPLSDDAGNAIRIPALSSSKKQHNNEDEKDFHITPALLEVAEKRSLRVLIAVGGLFRAGQLSAVRAPDLYGIKLDGERGQRTHIYTKEEILKDVVLEVRGKYPLKKGTRVCAYWSSQYLSLYPGYVTSFSSSDDDSEDENYTAVEFDDGDSGRIRYTDIRLLPQDFCLRRHSMEDLANSSENETIHKRKLSDTYFEEMAVRERHRHRHRHRSHPVEGSKNDEIKLLQQHSTFSSASASSTSSSSPSSSCASLSVPPFFSKAEGTTNEKQQHREGNDDENDDRKRTKKKRKREFREKFVAHEKYDAEAFVDANGNVEKREKRKRKHREHRKKKKKRACRSKERDRDVESSRAFDRGERDADAANANDHDEVVHSPPDLDLIAENATNPPEQLSPNGPETLLLPSHSDDYRVRTASADSSPLPEPASKVDDSNAEDAEASTTEKCERPTSASKNDAEGDEKGDEIAAAIDSTSSSNSDQKEDTSTEVEGVTISEEEATITPNETGKEDEEGNRDNNDELKTAKVRTQEAQPSSTTEDVAEEADSEDEESSQTTANANDTFWHWHGKGLKRNGKGRARKEFYKCIKRGDVLINVGDCAVFLTANSWAKPFIGRVESMWESYGNMSVRVNWFYHPEETVGLQRELPFLGGALFESPHTDKNDVQTISHKCEVVSLQEYRERIAKEAQPEVGNRLYYLAGHYDPTAKRLNFEEGVFP